MSDPLASGLIGVLQFQNGELGKGFTFQQPLRRWIFRKNLTLAAKEDKANVAFEDDRETATLTIDEKNGCTPVLLELKSKIDQTTQTTRATWEKKGEVWVPQTCVMELVHHGPEISISSSLEFEWESINQPLDPKLMDYREAAGARSTNKNR